MTARERLRLHRKRAQVRERCRQRKRFLVPLLVANVVLAVLWGPIFITLTLLGPLRHLSSLVVWVAMISYYANMMGNVATAAAVYSSLISHDAHETAVEAEVAVADLEPAQ